MMSTESSGLKGPAAGARDGREKRKFYYNYNYYNLPKQKVHEPARTETDVLLNRADID